ncbi:AAA family ATPase [Evansella sp. AB-P1]|uniref:AAA family ATPase n=1 Tax=Evansella sp. AB-P1 TaxID=3037653 RepID=UPI00241F800F|nr:AAA family ATPase [Evansella sp. AB-P1]MDG5787158.1 AAA family ATPase [Evansella sp. AB-P1]
MMINNEAFLNKLQDIAIRVFNIEFLVVLFLSLLAITLSLYGLAYLVEKKANRKVKNEKRNENKGEDEVNPSFELTQSTTTFQDIAGYDYVKEELVEIIDQLSNPRKYEAIGANMIKGGILYGPPGTGKTLFAKAVAGECGMSFISTSGSDFVDQFVGQGANRARELFNLARENQPCIIFIDEIDAIGNTRSGSFQSREYDNTVNALLVELQGFRNDEEIFVFGATNQMDHLDPALIRAGRLEKKIKVDLPNEKTRLHILQFLTTQGNRRFSNNIKLSAISKLTYQFSPAQLEQLVNEAVLLAARDNKREATQKYLIRALDKISNGITDKKIITEKERKIVAVHEAGHAVVTKYLKPHDIIQKITILPEGNSLGKVVKSYNHEPSLMTKEEFESEVKILLAGRAAEEVFYGSVTNGAEQDLKVATTIVNNMLTKYGMLNQLCTIEGEGDYHAINEVLATYYKEVCLLLKKELREQVVLTTKCLLRKETLTTKDFDIIYNYPKEKRKQEEQNELQQQLA